MRELRIYVKGPGLIPLRDRLLVASADVIVEEDGTVIKNNRGYRFDRIHLINGGSQPEVGTPTNDLGPMERLKQWIHKRRGMFRQ